MIYHDPASLTPLQDIHLPDVVYDHTNTDAEVGALRKSFVDNQALLAYPNVMGAICLSEAGLALTASKPIVHDLFTGAISSEVAIDQLGAGVDELIRHHPSLRPLVANAAKEILIAVTASAIAFEASDEPAYSWNPVSLEAETSNKPLREMARLAKVRRIARKQISDGKACGSLIAECPIPGRISRKRCTQTPHPFPVLQLSASKLETGPPVSSVSPHKRLGGWFADSPRGHTGESRRCASTLGFVVNLGPPPPIRRRIYPLTDERCSSHEQCSIVDLYSARCGSLAPVLLFAASCREHCFGIVGQLSDARESIRRRQTELRLCQVVQK